MSHRLSAIAIKAVVAAPAKLISEWSYATDIHSILVCYAIAASARICGPIVWIFIKSKNSINKMHMNDNQINLCTHLSPDYDAT